MTLIISIILGILLFTVIFIIDRRKEKKEYGLKIKPAWYSKKFVHVLYRKRGQLFWTTILHYSDTHHDISELSFSYHENVHSEIREKFHSLESIYAHQRQEQAKMRAHLRRVMDTENRLKKNISKEII